MEKHCQYCGSTVTKLDHFGYCIHYYCFNRAGKKIILDNLIRKATNLWFGDSTGQVSGPVSNFYSKNHRKADGLKRESEREFGFIPYELLSRMPPKFRNEAWDKNIRW